MSLGPFNNGLMSWIFFVLFVVAFATCVWAFVYWWKKDRHTRERFAFFGAAALITLTTILVMQLTNNYSVSAVIVGFVVGIIKFVGLADLVGLTGYSYEPKQLTPVEAVMVLIVLFGLGAWFYKVFRYWDGQKSKAQHEQEQSGISPSVWADVLLLLARDRRLRDKLTPYREILEESGSLLQGVEDTRAWHEQARQLWLLNRRHYVIEDEYDSLHKCWWGEEKHTGAVVCLACYMDMPAETEIAALLDYVQEVTKARPAKRAEIIVASKSGDFESSTEKRDESTLFRTNQLKLLDQLIDFSDYYDDIRYRVERLTLPDSELTLEKTYTPSRFRLPGGAAQEVADLESYILEWLHDNTRRQLALLGEYGQGKSTISLVLSYNLIERVNRRMKARIPVLIELRGKSPRSLTPEELLATWAYRYRIDVQALIQLLMAGRLVLIFEGFDEIDLTGDTDTRLNHFRTLWRLSYPQAKILITGRPNFFLDDTERKRALGIEAPHPNRPYCEAILLAPFSFEQIDHSLRNVDPETRREIIDLSKENAKFYEIVSRPSLLFIVSTLWKREKLSERRDKISSALVMELFIRHSYRRQGAKETERNFMALNSAERAYFMLGIAGYMAVRGLPNQIAKHQLDEAIHRLIEVIPDEVSRSVRATSNETPLPLKHKDRFDWERNKAEVLEHIKTDVRACGILVTDFSKDGSFKLAHKSFMEFLQAQLFCEVFSVDDALQQGARSILNAFSLNISHLDSSPEALTFLAELLRDRVQAAGEQNEDEVVAKTLFNIFVLGNLDRQGFTVRMGTCLVRTQLWIVDHLPFLLNKYNLQAGLVVSRLATMSLLMMVLFLLILWRDENYGRNMFFYRSLFLTQMIVVFIMTMIAMRIALRRPKIEFGIAWRMRMWFKVCRDFGVSSSIVVGYIGRNIAASLEKDYSQNRAEKLIAIDNQFESVDRRPVAASDKI